MPIIQCRGGGGGQSLKHKSCEHLDCQNNGKNCGNVSNKDNTAIVGKNPSLNENLSQNKNLNLKPFIVIARREKPDEAIHSVLPGQHTFKLLRRFMDCCALRARNDKCRTSGSTQRQKCARNDGKSSSVVIARRTESDEAIHYHKNRKFLGSRGGVLVEFAIGAPILITIMLYGHDVFKMARMHERMEFVAHEMAGILQNISKNRADKKITANDIKYAVASAYLSIYPGTTMYVTNTNGRRHVYGHAVFGYIYAVEGLSNGKVKILWSVNFHLTGDATACTSPATMRIIIANIKGAESIIPSNEFYLSQISPGSTIKDKELKIIVECCLFYEHTSYYGLADGRNWGQISARQAFGFFIMDPKPKSGRTYFNEIVIFSPRPGLFDEISPSSQ